MWETTAEFLKAVAEPRLWYGQSPSDPILKPEARLLDELPEELGLGPKGRAYVEVDREPAGLHKHESFDDALVGEKRCDVVYEGANRRFWLVGEANEDKGWIGQELRLTRDDGKEHAPLRIVGVGSKPKAYFPWRIISRSPQMLLLLVPAGAAVEITRRLYCRYLKEFGKVYGRLPLSVANIFFPKHLPMFSVLDAARRIERAFRELSQDERGWITGALPREPQGLALTLGGGERDTQHPYVRTAADQKARPSYFETIVGPVVHMDELGAGEPVLYRPNLYQCEMLGSSADRFQFHFNLESLKERPNPEDLWRATRQADRPESGPVLLDEFESRMMPLWGALRRSGIADSSLRNLERTLTSRRHAWLGSDRQKAREALDALAQALCAHYFDEGERAIVHNAIRDGFFFRTLNLYLRILKERTEKGASDGDANVPQAANLPC